jgi:hypothetical protein
MDNPGVKGKRRQRQTGTTVISFNCRNLIVLDWSDPIDIDWRDPIRWNKGQQEPCVHCSKPTLLLDDAGLPSHKVCAEAAATARTALHTQREAAAKAA